MSRAEITLRAAAAQTSRQAPARPRTTQARATPSTEQVSADGFEARAPSTGGARLWKTAPEGVEVIKNEEQRGEWVEKWINPKDGKWVHNYTLETMQANAREKFADNRAFGKALPKIRARYEDDLDKPGKEGVLALIVALIDQTYFRIGNEESEGNGVYGVTTLLGKHVRIDGDKATFDFIGKKKKEQHAVVCDPVIVAKLAALKAACKKGTELLFRVEGKRIRPNDVNAYLAPYTAKKFRTYHATRLARRMLLDHKGVEPAERERAVKEVVREVAKKLGHTPSVCKGSYIDPTVIDAYLRGKLS